MNFSIKTFLGGWVLLAAIAMQAQTAVNVGKLPLWFEAGREPGGSAGQFTAHGRDAEFSVSPAGAHFALRRTDGRLAGVSLTFAGGAADPKISGEAEQTGKINYLIGNNPAGWRSGISTFGKVRLQNVYPGVNAVFYGNQQELEYDLDLAAGVNPGTVALHFEGAQKISVNAKGELVIGLDGGEVIQHPPVAYQTGADGRRHDLAAGYKVVDADTVEFALGDYDHDRPLVIDPILGYSSFFGGNFGDIGWAIALDSTNNIYVAGQTFSTALSAGVPFTTNAIFPHFSGGAQIGDAFVAELDSTGTNLIYCTYLGGTLNDVAYALAVDRVGHAYVAGATDSTDFPVTTNTIVNGTFSGGKIHGVPDPDLHIFPTDGFVAELDINGARLVYSSYLGGESTDIALGIALDGQGDAFVAGETYSTNFPVTSGAFQAKLQCTNSYDVNANAFVTEIASNGTALNYSTYLGGTNLDAAHAIAFNNGFVYVAGSTESTNFPWVQGLLSNHKLNNFTDSKNQVDNAADAFVTVFTTNSVKGIALVYSTFLGNTNSEVALGVAGDANGNAYVVGRTTSVNFTNTIGTNFVKLFSAVRTNATGFVLATNAFFTKILYPTLASGMNATIAYSQVFGGSGNDRANGVALDPAGDVFVVGTATSGNFPTTDNLFGSLRRTNSSMINSTTILPDVFVTAFKSDFSALLYSTYLGGASYDYGNGIAVDTNGNAYITGQTLSGTFPTVNGFRHTRDGTNDAFVSKILLNTGVPPLALARTGTNVEVSWQSTSTQTAPPLLVVESTTNLTTTWKTVTGTPMLINSNYVFTFVPTNGMQFFRFRPN